MTEKFDTFVEKLINSFEELPQNPPYGFWISPEGNLYTVLSSFGHESEAIKILTTYEPKYNTQKYYDDHGWFLIKKGFVRIVIENDEMYLDHSYYEEGRPIVVPISPKARKSAKDISDFYNLNISR